ncbi:MAG: outer membrane protein beta-barrel protein [Mucilaginibacter sp.]|nr:outer membrane protein beta-barrel protein [Mucilaginibacter sp.]
MKKFILFFVISLTTVAAKAQGGYNYSQFGVGVGVGYGRAFADTKRQDYHPAFNINFVYNYGPFIPVALEFQFGTLSGGGRTIDKDPYGRIYKNNYKALILHADLQAGDIMDYSNSNFLNMLKNFYIGTGIGAINNKMADIQRTNLYPQNGPIGTTIGFEGKDKSTNLLIPLRFGYEFKIFDSYDEPSYTITIGYQHNITFGEGLDGYNDNPDKFKNNAPDQYAQLTIGFKFSFGNSVSYTKQIRHSQF